MDTFEVLSAVSKRKKSFMHAGVTEHEALNRAEHDISSEYHIPLHDVKRLVE